MAYENVTNALTTQKIPGVPIDRMKDEVWRYELFGNSPGYAGITPDEYSQYTQALGVQGTGPGNQTGPVMSEVRQPGQATFGGTVAQPGDLGAQTSGGSQSIPQDQLSRILAGETINGWQSGRGNYIGPPITEANDGSGDPRNYETVIYGPDAGSTGSTARWNTWNADGTYRGTGSGPGQNWDTAVMLATGAALGGAAAGAGAGATSAGGYVDPIVFTGAEGAAGTAAGGAAAGGLGSLGQTAAQGIGSSAVSQAIQSGGANPGNPSTGIFSNVKDALPLVGAAATLASGGGSAKAPAAPDYVKAAIATSNSGRYDERTPYGTVTWSLRPGADPNNPQPGDYIRTTNFSPEQQRLYDLNTANQLQAGQVGGQQLAELGQGRQSVQDALYRRATQYYDQNFGDQENQLRTRLTNQGLNEGTEAFTRELRNFRQGRDTAYADATDRAIAGADQQENNAVARIVNILNMSKATTPTSGNSAGGAGTDLLSAANQAYTANLGATNAQNARDAQQQNALLQLVLGGMKYYGG